MTFVVLLLMCATFVELFRALGLGRHVGVTTRVSGQALEALRSTTLTDEEKEAAMQRSSLALIQQTGLFVGKFLLILGALAAIYLAAVHLAGVNGDRLDAHLLSPVSWVAMTAAAMLYAWLRYAVTKRL